MKIQPNRISPNLETEQTGKTQKASSGAVNSTGRAADGISVDQVATANLADHAMSLPEVRMDKVNALRQAISSGQYKVDPQKVADAIVDEYKK